MEDSISGIGIIPINDLTDTVISDWYFFNLDHFIMITKKNGKIYYKKILFSEILYQINIEISEDSYISLSEDE